MNPIVECVPNFSEGRRKDVIDAILAEIASVPGPTLLDHHADADHNRLVITFRPDRVNLENVRRGQYEGLKVEIETHPVRRPDLGPARLGKAGATIMWDRDPSPRSGSG